VANAIAPEHLQLMTADPDALLPLVRHAGAVFCGPYAPASVGDYVAGPSHVLPTYGSARFAGALRVDDFVKHVHVVSLDAVTLARLAPSVIAGRSRGPGQPRRVRTHPGPAMTKSLPPIRDDLEILAGYHSAQVDVDVRLNTNESPYPPPAGLLDELAEQIRTVPMNRYPDRDARALRAALAEHHGVRPEQVFAANGSNEILQLLFTAYGGAGRAAAVFEPTYALHSHIAKLTGTAVARGERRDDFSLELDEVKRVLGDADPILTFLCSPNNPTGRAEPRELIEATLGAVPGLLVVDEAYGQFARWSALELVADDVPLVVVRTYSKTWSMAALRLGYCVAPAEVVAALEQTALPYHLDAVKQIAGRIALRHHVEMEARVKAITAERRRVVERLEALRVDLWPSDANFVLFRPQNKRGRDVWQHLVDRSVLIRDCSAWPGLDDCLRITIGTPAEDDRFLAALEEALA
jgi:histidinol-phosphate aminotransferase